MDADALVSRLEQALPGFRIYVESEANLFDRSSAHRIFAACSHYVRERSVSPMAWQSLATLVNGIVGSSDAEFDNAACTCFLENLAETGHPLARLLRGEALTFWQQWAGA